MASQPRRVLLAGESWIMHTIHQKGVDSFTTTAYGTGHKWLQGALEAGGWEVEHLPNHLAPEAFPTTMAELRRLRRGHPQRYRGEFAAALAGHVRALALGAEPAGAAARLGRRAAAGW